MTRYTAWLAGVLLATVVATPGYAQQDQPPGDEQATPPQAVAGPAVNTANEDAALESALLENPFLVPGSLESYLAETGRWGARVDDLIEQIAAFQKDAADADALYLDLGNALRRRLDYLRSNLIDARSPLEELDNTPDLPDSIRTIAQLFARVEAMYAARLRLLNFITPALHREITGVDVYGAQELSLELFFIWQQIHFQALSIPAASEDLWRRFRVAPLPLIWGALEVMLAIVVFRWWRHWFPDTLRRVRAYLMEMRPRSPAIVRRIKLIWYIDQLRRPVEWLILFQIFFTMIDMPGLNFILEVVAIVVRWMLLGWFSVALLNAVAARGDAGLAGEQARLRLRSIRLVTAWLVLLGLGLNVTDSLAGVAGVHAWMWRAFQILALPVFFVLLSWWRQSIFERVEREQDDADSTTDLLRHRTGWRSYSSAASAAVWLLANRLRRSLIQGVSRLGTDQGFRDQYITQPTETTEDAAAASPPAVLPESLRKKLLTRVDFYERFARSERRELLQRARRSRGGIVVVTGERGIGKSGLLEHMKKLTGEDMILVECMNENYEELLGNLGHALDIKTVTPEKVTQALAGSGVHTIAIDNLHRLVRPVIGGLDNLACLADFIQSIPTNVMWLISTDCFAWQFIRRARADRASASEVIELRSWPETQLAELLDQRTSEAGIEPDFSGVRVPKEYLETALEDAVERNKTGVYRMIWALSGGNPSVALRIWADCLSPNDSSGFTVRVPVPPSARDLDSASRNILLVLRAIAQSEQITEQDIADNLRLPQGAVSSAIHYSALRGWIEEIGGRYRLSWQWFRTINRVLSRHNLLAR